MFEGGIFFVIGGFVLAALLAYAFSEVLADILEPIIELLVRGFQRVFLGIGRPAVGDEPLIGATGTASNFSEVDGSTFTGSVMVDGESWRATADVLVESGTRVRVLERNELTLRVEPVDRS